MKRTALILLALATLGCVCVLCGAASSRAADPQFTATGELILPKDYRGWVTVGVGLGMTYGPTPRPAGQAAVFTNVFVAPDAYRAFMASGVWPEGTTFLIEGRSGVDRPLLANQGLTQGNAIFLEASVKDSARFPATKWAYFNFGNPRSPSASAKPLPTSDDCYSCHVENTAVDNTFVQFYPDLLDVARARGTVKPAFDPTRQF